MRRREFVALGALGAGATAFPWTLRQGARPGQLLARPFELGRVRLLPGPLLEQTQLNRKFLLAQDPDRLLHMFRVTAGIPSSAEPLGGWEAPVNELRGHYTGHYLSACAMLAAQGDAELKARGEQLVAELAKCQQPNGYLSAFPEEFFDRLRADRPVWAPFYTIHKIMAGLLDMRQHAGNAQALELVSGMARWTSRWTQPLGEYEMARVLEREYGGMNEVLYNLAAATGDNGLRGTARRFDHERIFAPLAQGVDQLKGLHANTTIPKIIGAARRYELSGDPRYRRIAEYFWREVTTARAFCTGGTSNGEGWNSEPYVLANQLSGYTQEDCVTYNMMKLTRHLFSWTADPACADYYERALWNGIIGSQHPADGDKLYYVSLASGLWKLFGTPGQDYWCCTGSMSEAFSKLGDSIYFEDERGLYVNLFAASELDWQAKGVRVLQETRFPEEDTTTLTIRAARPAAFALRVRVPYWATGTNSASLNGKGLEGFAGPGGYYVLERSWKDGDRLTLRFPMRLHAQAMPDDPSLRAFLYGPLVLAGRLGTEGLTPATLRAEPTKPRTVPSYKLEPVAVPAFKAAGEELGWIQPAGQPLEFRTTGQAQDVTLVPFYRLFDERYAVYWRVTSDQ
ncbi:MAG TPA: beta-L-arabinofuranosidase domain-containing protein [Gemmatimonadales bacterium]|nr:beta-L-arabinofuranosidase domain-containing protein [Gemmatimonadales bacterium]